MGANASNIIRADLAHHSIDQLLSSDEYIAGLETWKDQLTINARRNLKRISSVNQEEPKRPLAESSRLQPLWKVTRAQIVLPPNILGYFESWKLDPATFLYRDACKKPTCPTTHYQYAEQLQTSLASDKIIWRFLTTTYYDVATLLSKSRRFGGDKEAVEFLLNAIIASSNEGGEDVRQNLWSWINEGKRNRALAEKLGSTGCYFFYPDISEWIWKKYLPLSLYDRAAKHLRDQGILQEAEQSGAVRLSRQIELILIKPFQETVLSGTEQGEWVFWNSSNACERNGIDVNTGDALSMQDMLEQNGPETAQPGIATNKTIEVDSSATSTPPVLSENAEPRLASNGLIKVQWPSSIRAPSFDNLEQDLFQFCCVCPGRTILTDNAYLCEFLPILQSNGPSMNSVLALSATYYKDYYPEETLHRRQIEHAELRYSAANAAEVAQAVTAGDLGAPTAVAAALLLHHATMNPEIYSGCWTTYLYPFADGRGIHLNSTLAMASVAILAMTALPSRGAAFQDRSYDWIKHGSVEQLTEVNGTLGLSRAMLHLVHRITELAKSYTSEKTTDEQNLVRLEAMCLSREIERSPLWVAATECAQTRFFALLTAETYRTGARIYCLARLCGYTPWHNEVSRLCKQLVDQLRQLPTDGQWYSSIHPAWSFVIACICVKDRGWFSELFACMRRIAGDNKSNVDDCCGLVRRVKEWQLRRWSDKNVPVEDFGWWNNMTSDVSENSVVCLA